MKQCPYCLRFWPEDHNTCDACGTALPTSEASSEDADHGHFVPVPVPEAKYTYKCPFCSFSFPSDLDDTMNCWHCDHVMKQIAAPTQDEREELAAFRSMDADQFAIYLHNKKYGIQQEGN